MLFTAGITTFGVIFLAELGDKSQLVCMTLAARHQHLPVLIGAIVAFMLLNGLAVIFGVGIGHWLPDWLVALIVGVLFASFGIITLYHAANNTEENAVIQSYSNRSIFLTTFALLFLAEMGDKTQLAVAGLASHLPVFSVWLGATLALTFTSALGVILGQSLLRYLPIQRLHQIGGMAFLILAGLAFAQLLNLLFA
ncbi:TMEM165/GDT1 family protein [Rhodoferax sp. 4810]|uniref:GDT1 family protein n=1 Tax=Thiospirillum jenense TaxID=1653858 RepID=A0A839HDE7_9GAMM|nr:TMEM165/GDT1 family protein [Thiospirillum jenense]MBB1074550.1 TMEM165/GDT1 family protein [Rhodoferax jenense]MBB1126524.1 TMEM165/GDT1 family protein [Thiospirillum jenense]